MKTANCETGRLAENFAARVLAKKGYIILEQNFSNKFGEIDIIARDGKILVFVEVKAKIGGDFGLPEDMINPGKLQRVRNMATMYMKGELLPCRVDVVAVVLDEESNVIRLTHYENVY